MRLRFFHASDGDCCLVSSGDLDGNGGVQHHALVDGGRKGTFEDHARKAIAELPRLDLVCVSHIDEDHIAGILGLVGDEVAWRVHEFRKAEGLSTRKPRFPRPPAITEIWHNGLFALVGEDLAPEVEGALEATASLFAGSPDERVRDFASRMANLANGERSAMELSRRISDQQLGIAQNRPRGALMTREGAEEIEIGDLRFLMLGPTEDDIAKLREEWQTWLDGNAEALAGLQAEMLEDEGEMGLFQRLTRAHPRVAMALGDGAGSVTAPNLASLMFLVESGDMTVLLTGDGVSDAILEGLEHHDRLDSQGRLHVDVLKVQHHGAEANVTGEFVRRITADHYVFCGNGAHENPEEEVVRAFALARLEGIGGEGPVGPDRPFRFHFTSSSKTKDLSDSRVAHLKKIEKRVKTLKEDHDPNGRLSSEAISKGALTIELP